MVYHQAKLFHYRPKRLSFTPESMMYSSPINHRLRANTWLNRRQYIIFSAPADYLFPGESVWRRMKPRFHTYFIVCLLLAKKWRHEGGFWFPNREKPKWTGLLCSWFFKNLPFHRTESFCVVLLSRVPTIITGRFFDSFLWRIYSGNKKNVGWAK